MDAITCSNGNEPLSIRYARLWDASLSAPDVFAFLSSYPEVPASERLEVLLLDQHLRWQRGQPLPLRIYLSAYPDLAVKSEVVRALVDNERRERRGSTDRPNQTVSLGPDDSALGVFTERIEARPEIPATDDELKARAPAQVPSTASDLKVSRHEVGSTKSPANPKPTDERLSFDLDDAYHLKAEAESLRTMLNTVRFTLVRRLGAGGMGVVYEAYDQQRGDLVALKTMRRVDPQALVRFKHEFRTLCDISHPNLVDLYELFAVEDRWFFTMELVDGSDFISFVTAPEVAESAGVAADRIVADPREAGRRFDETRLRDALRQLAEGIDELHQAGKLHRDIKPTNVLVTPEGRVVLLDFGLTADLQSTGTLQTPDRQIVGTLAHMSPEQATGRSITTASDWYSVGVMLYEVMTGRLPFAGTGPEILVSKQTEIPVSPRTLIPQLPEDLVSLCDDLLDRDPSRRPIGRDILAQLRGTDRVTVDVHELNRALPFIGRSRHRQFLDGVFSTLSRGKTQSVFIFGRTGTGKTTLVRSFLDELIAKDEAVVLFGRCYERESVPYKALDSLIDSLARFLRELPSHEIEALLPPNVAYLARVFPVLQSVQAVDALRRLAPDLPDQQEVRRRAFAGLRELVGGLSEHNPLVLAIDDLQWGDVDSAFLLSDLICSPQSPVLLFIGCFRSEDSERSPFLNEIGKAIASEPVKLEHRELAVEPLTQAEARELTLALLGKDDAVSRAQAHVVARESGGNPLFVDELVKHIQSGEPTERWNDLGNLDLDEVLWARILRQSEEARRLLGVVSISGRPIGQTLAFEAAELGTASRAALASLRAARLIRCLGQTHNDQIEIYHDRIRETVVTHLAPDVAQAHHRRLAALLTKSGEFDTEVLAGHFRGSGDNSRACQFYARAADQAAVALAFDHAARLYRIALELHPGSDVSTQLLWKNLGNALANAGRGAESAQAYLEAANSATAAEAFELKRLASAQLLISGHVTEGLALLRTLLGPMGLSMPDSTRQAQLSVVWHRALLRLRGLKFKRRDESAVSPLDLTKIDLCWSAVAGLSMIEPVRGADFQARGLLLALRAGEPVRLVRAIAMEAAHRSTAGDVAIPRVTTLLKTADELTHHVDSPYARGIVELARGVSSLMLGRWQLAQTSLDEAEQIFRNQCTGVTWERDTAHNFALWALLQMGQIAELKRRWRRLYQESREKGDLYATRMLTTFYMTMIKLAANEPIDSEADLQASLNRCAEGPFNLEHSYAFDSLMHLHLYRGDIHNAWSRITLLWPEYSRSLLSKIQMIRINMLESRARIALAMAEKSDESAPFLVQAEQDADALEAEGLPWARAHARYVRAGIAACGQDTIKAIEDLQNAVDEYDKAGMPLRAWILRYRLGEVQEGEERREMRETAESWIREQGIVAPVRWAGMYAPGFACISSDVIETSY